MLVLFWAFFNVIIQFCFKFSLPSPCTSKKRIIKKEKKRKQFNNASLLTVMGFYDISNEISWSIMLACPSLIFFFSIQHNNFALIICNDSLAFYGKGIDFRSQSTYCRGKCCYFNIGLMLIQYCVVIVCCNIHIKNVSCRGFSLSPSLPQTLFLHHSLHPSLFQGTVGKKSQNYCSVLFWLFCSD